MGVDAPRDEQRRSVQDFGREQTNRHANSTTEQPSDGAGAPGSLLLGQVSVITGAASNSRPDPSWLLDAPSGGRSMGRAPSTVKREMDRHRDEQGRYLAHGADHRAAVSRGRPRAHKLSANPQLREAVQRKLNRCWSPEEIAGWLKLTYPANAQMSVCAETIYRALLVPGGQGLHKRYCVKLRTGRKLRRSRWLTRSSRVGAVTNMTMISDRPAEVETKQTVGDWEGDLIIGLGSASAMMTLRERKTQYGIVVNLPADHTAESVNAAAIKAFSSMPRHLKRTLTWDQGSEMAKHREARCGDGNPDLLCGAVQPVAARCERELQRLGSAIFPQEHRSFSPPDSPCERRGARAEHSTPQDPRLPHPSRVVPSRSPR